MISNPDNGALLQILIVDDEAGIRNFLQEFIISRGMQVQVAADGEAALELLGSQKFNLILSDLTLPDISGFELIERAREIAPDLTAVMMSGMPPESTEELVRYGIVEYLTKPFSLEELDYLLGKYKRYFKAIIENDQLKEKLKGYEEERRFFYEAGHQLKTPVAVLKEFAHLFREGFGGKIAGKQRTYLEAIDQNIDRLLYLVENIEGFGKLDSSTWMIRLEQTDPQEIVSQVCDSWRPVLARRNLYLLEELPEHLPTVQADVAAVQQVLFNLMDNASKYAPAETTVTLRCFQPDDHSVRIQIEDEGTAIPVEMREMLFLPFTRLPKHESEPGLGLGLSVAQGLMRLMEGDLWLADNPGDRGEPAGNRFCIRLPVASSAS